MSNKGIYINESAYTTGFQSLESAIDNIDVSNQLDGVLTSLESETNNRISVDESLESAIRIKNYVIVDTIEDRNNIPENERLIGQLVYVNEDSTEYRLIGTLSNESWVASSSDESESSARISADNSLESAINDIDITDQLDGVLTSLETLITTNDTSLETAISEIDGDLSGDITSLETVWSTISLNDLSNTNIGTLSNSQLLRYDTATSKWVNFTPSWVTTDTNTTYSINVPNATKKIQLLGSDSSTSEIEFLQGSNIVITRTSATQLSIDTATNVQFGQIGIGVAPSATYKVYTDGYISGTRYYVGTTRKDLEWDTAYTDHLKWDGGSAGLDPATGRTSLGLGTAATHDAQTALADTTAGRLMKVGAFGLGSEESIELTGSEWDIVTMPNQFVQGGIFNRTCVGLNLSYSSFYDHALCAQLFMGVSGDLSIKARATSTVGIWGDVEELYHTGNLVNPVTGTGTGQATVGQIAVFNGDRSITGSNNFLYYTESNVLYNAGSIFNGGMILAVAPSDSDWGFISRNSSGTSDSGIYWNAKNATLRLRDSGNTDRIILNANTDSYLTYGLSIGKTTVTSGYTLDVNGAIQSTELKVGTLSGLLKASSGVVGTTVSGTDIKTVATNSILGSGSLINIYIAAVEPTGGTYYNGDIWVE